MVKQPYFFAAVILIAVVAVVLMFSSVNGQTAKFYSVAKKTTASQQSSIISGPIKEVCTDGRDNDWDGLVDCRDKDCDGQIYNLGKGWKCEFGAELSCNDIADNDFDGKIDCNDNDCFAQFYTDNDRDFYGDPNKPTVMNCKTAFIPLMSLDARDCDDNNMWIRPGAAEVCDGVDNNCDGKTDEGFDVDNDGYAPCGAKRDCDDNDINIHPGAADVCDDGIDQDCSGADKVCVDVTTCTDTDGGIDDSTKGTITISNGSTATDFCSVNKYLYEARCEASGDGGTVFVDCTASGKVCSDGACVVGCTDTDGGKDDSVKGTVTTHNGSVSTDSCGTQRYLKEEYCDGADVKFINIDCNANNKACSDGACQ